MPKIAAVAAISGVVFSLAPPRERPGAAGSPGVRATCHARR